MGQYDFDFKKYDIGGYNAIKGDGKLTGDEVKKAQNDGFTNVWEGFTAKDKAPVNVNIAKAEEEKKEHAFDFDEYDIGGNGAIPKDKMLTGDEVKRAKAAGYEGVYEGIKKERSSYVFESSDVGTAFGMFSRTAARKSNSKTLVTAGAMLDVISFPIEFSVALIQRFIREE